MKKQWIRLEDTLAKSEAGELGTVEYYIEDAKKDKLTVKAQTVVQFVKYLRSIC